MKGNSAEGGISVRGSLQRAQRVGVKNQCHTPVAQNSATGHAKGVFEGFAQGLDDNLTFANQAIDQDAAHLRT